MAKKVRVKKSDKHTDAAVKNPRSSGAVEEGPSQPDKLKRKDYEVELKRLQAELCALQDWVKRTGQRIIIVFEGRDAAGKGGTIRAITERVSPRVFRLVALPAPSDREKSQVYAQRYIAHFPAAGEIVIFDRSWYNRAGVERVMGFATEDQVKRFLQLVPHFEKNMVIDNGILLLKYWLEVGEQEQERRFEARIKDPLRQWKLSPMDLPSRERWYQYSKARDEMLEATDTDWAPWHVVRSDDKKRARLNVISHILSQLDYDPLPKSKIKLPEVSKKGAYDDVTPMLSRRWIPEKF
jgi:polyphosphate kinase 2